MLQEVRILDVFIHPLYLQNPQEATYDVSVLKIQPVKLDEAIRSAVLETWQVGCVWAVLK